MYFWFSNKILQFYDFLWNLIFLQKQAKKLVFLRKKKHEKKWNWEKKVK